jgi:hypothetical protein
LPGVAKEIWKTLKGKELATHKSHQILCQDGDADHANSVESNHEDEGTDSNDRLEGSVSLPTIPSHNPASLVSKCRITLQLLLASPLFDPAELQHELELLKNRALLCPSKFCNTRMPHMSDKPNLGRVPSSLPLPDTEGETLVEEMIELGELCFWISQKNERTWFYQRVLSETLYKTMLRLGPLFHLERLRYVFRSSNGTGICSQRLIDAINEMVSEANKPGAKAKTFKFDANKILGKRFQQKFCSSVEVVMKPYRGRDALGHKAQHFREVFFLVMIAYSRSYLECFWHGLCKS